MTVLRRADASGRPFAANGGQNMNKKNNRRAQLTRRVFRETLVELLNEKPLGKITVSEICAAAEMNRSTFYAHYTDVDAVAEELRNSFFEQLDTELRDTAPDDFTEHMKQYLHYVFLNREVILLLMREQPDLFRDRMIGVSAELSSAALKDAPSPEEDPYLRTRLRFLTGGGIYVIEQWLKDPDPLPPDRMAEQLFALSAALLST